MNNIISIQYLAKESFIIRRLALGFLTSVTLVELIDILSRQNYLNFNTLSVQKSGDIFWCQVDEPTVEYWSRRLLEWEQNNPEEYGNNTTLKINYLTLSNY